MFCKKAIGLLNQNKLVISVHESKYLCRFKILKFKLASYKEFLYELNEVVETYDCVYIELNIRSRYPILGENSSNESYDDNAFIHSKDLLKYIIASYSLGQLDRFDTKISVKIIANC